MRSKQFKAFDMVALEESFSKAALRLGVTQPAVTYQVRKLEQEYGCILFERSSHGVKLTEEGLKLFGITRRFVLAKQEAEEYLDAGKELNTGTLRISSDSIVIALELSKLFLSKYPNIQLSMKFNNSKEILKDLNEKRADIVISGRIQTDEKYNSTRLLRQSLCALVPSNHICINQNMYDVRQFPTERYLLREGTSLTAHEVSEHFKKNNFIPQSTMELNGVEAVKEAVAKKLGIGFIFEGDVELDSRIRTIPLLNCTSSSESSLICLKRQMQRPIIHEFFLIANKLETSSIF